MSNHAWPGLYSTGPRHSTYRVAYQMPAVLLLGTPMHNKLNTALFVLATAAVAVLVPQTIALAAEGGETPSPLPTHGYDATTGLVTLIVFLLTLLILTVVAWKPIMNGLAAREGKIRSDIEGAEQANKDAKATLAQYQTQLREAETRVKDMLVKAQTDAEALGTRIKMQAQQEVEEIKTRAAKEIESSKAAALSEIREQAAMLSTAVASKILRREINENDQRELIRSSLEQLSGRN
jgi:F-type H+-transporting ATPase subunit b